MYAPVTASLATPIGWIVIEGDADEVQRIGLHCDGAAKTAHGAVGEAAAQLAAYFAGRLRQFDLPLVPADTQRGCALREAIAAIGYGETTNYGALALRSGSSARAIGQACARNRLPIVVPCHRVLQAGGALGPYSAGGGPVTKQWLLRFEGALLM